MVAMEMRDDDRVDLCRIDAGRREPLRGQARAGVERAWAIAGIDHDQAVASLDQQRVEHQSDFVAGHIVGGKRLLVLLETGAARRARDQLAAPHAVENRRDLDVADLDAMKSGRARLRI